MKQKKAFAIFSGNNQRAVIAFCRFAKHNHIPFYIVSSGEYDPIYHTTYSNHVVFKRSSRSLKYHHIKNILVNIISDYELNHIIILPSTEYLNRFLLKHKEDFLTNNIWIPLVDAPLYQQISDKKNFTKTCSDYGLCIPRESENPGDLKFPFVVKPRRYFNSKKEVQFKPIVMHNTQAFKELAKEIDLRECFFQQYIDGRCFYLLFYISQNGNDVVYSQENLVQQADGGSMIGAVPSDVHTKKIAQDYLGLLKEINFHGIIMVELKYSNEKYYMIEANPRLWGPSQFFLDAGVPIFDNFVKEFGFNISSNNKKNKNIKYFWYGGMVENYQSQKTLSFYNYDEKKLIDDLPAWLYHEIYRRSDTDEIFIQESLEKS